MTTDKSLKILVAEDEYLISEDIIRGLKGRGYVNILEAVNGEEAIEKTCSNHPDIILMDIKMPKLDGIQAAKKILECSPTPVIIITAFESTELVEKAGIAGVSTFLTKPVQPDEIERAITIAMARHADLMELRRLNTELKRALEEIKKLQGILPICTICKKIRDDTGYWQKVETYIREHADVEFTHSMCPVCVKKFYKDEDLDLSTDME